MLSLCVERLYVNWFCVLCVHCVCVVMSSAGASSVCGCACLVCLIVCVACTLANVIGVLCVVLLVVHGFVLCWLCAVVLLEYVPWCVQYIDCAMFSV